MYKMVALDLDGTLFNSKTMISDKNKRAIQLCMEKDIKVVLASGRMYNFMKPLVEELNLHAHHHVACNGNTIFSHSGEVGEGVGMDKEVYKKLIKKYKEAGFQMAACTKDYIYYDDSPDLVDAFSKNPDGELKKVKSLMDLNNILKIVVYLEEKEKEREKLLRDLTQGDASVLRSYHLFVDVSSANVNKYTALERLAKQHKIDPKYIVAIGDSENDIDMVKNAGLGVAMANGSEKLKKIAKYISPKTNDEDGVAYIIEKFVLKKEKKIS